MGRRAGIILAAVALLAAGGCRNPFDPSADIELTRLSGNYGGAIVISGSELTSTDYPFGNWIVTCHFVYKNKVSAVISSVTITYSDLEGNPVTAYKSIGGRTYKMSFRIPGVVGNDMYDQAEGIGTDLQLYVVDKKVMAELYESASYPDNRVMFANIVFRGQDENGYDLRLEGRITIYLYP